MHHATSTPRSRVAAITALLALPLAAETASDPSWGFGFTMPAGWKIRQEPAGALLGVVAPSGGGAYVIAVSTPQAYWKELAAAA